MWKIWLLQSEVTILKIKFCFFFISRLLSNLVLIYHQCKRVNWFLNGFHPLKCDRQDKQGKQAFNERNPHMTPRRAQNGRNLMKHLPFVTRVTLNNTYVTHVNSVTFVTSLLEFLPLHIDTILCLNFSFQSKLS
jgi:hypothetical protein